MFLGYSEKDESLLRRHNNLTVLDAVSSLDNFMREEVNNQVKRLTLPYTRSDIFNQSAISLLESKFRDTFHERRFVSIRLQNWTNFKPPAFPRRAVKYSREGREKSREKRERRIGNIKANTKSRSPNLIMRDSVGDDVETRTYIYIFLLFFLFFFSFYLQTVCTLFLYNATRENVIAVARLGTDNPPLNSSQAQSLQHLLRVKVSKLQIETTLPVLVNSRISFWSYFPANSAPGPPDLTVTLLPPPAFQSTPAPLLLFGHSSTVLYVTRLLN